jgi:hypothetical protein
MLKAPVREVAGVARPTQLFVYRDGCKVCGIGSRPMSYHISQAPCIYAVLWEYSDMRC